MDKPHKKLDAWKKAMDLVADTYRITEHFPVEERFGLVRQMRRSAVLIPSNLAEGLARRGDTEAIQFVHFAVGSLSELDTQMDLCERLGFMTASDRDRLDGRLTDVDKLLVGLRNHLKRKTATKA